MPSASTLRLAGAEAAGAEAAGAAAEAGTGVTGALGTKTPKFTSHAAELNSLYSG